MKLKAFNNKTNARYGNPPNDGAKYSCADCMKLFNFAEIQLTAIPAGYKTLLCNDCIDEDWKQNAENCGQLEFDN